MYVVPCKQVWENKALSLQNMHFILYELPAQQTEKLHIHIYYVSTELLIPTSQYCVFQGLFGHSVRTLMVS